MIFRSIEAGLNSNVGCKRKNNQDNALASRGVYVVCDGMGGGKGGERASAQVAACFSQLAEQPSRNRTSIEHALSQSQQQVLELGQELGGIAGTTITGVVLPTRVEDSVHEQAIDEYCYVINVGDSRTYHMRADAEGHWMAESLTRITRDHSERQNAIDTGEMLPDEANRCIPRNIITQCVGAPDGIQPDWYAARSTGRFIICSDGLHAQIDRELLADVAAAYGDPQVAADMLVQSALDAGGNDNVTVIVLDICGKYRIIRQMTIGTSAKSTITRISAIYRKAHCKRYAPSNNAHVLAMTIVNNRICHVISAYSIQYLQNTR